MLILDGNNAIHLTRGDTAYITINIDMDGIELRDTDKVHCQVRSQPNGGYLWFEADLEPDGGQHIWHIRPDDTSRMKPGNYFYDIQVEIAESGDVFTVIPVSTFEVLSEVTEVS